MLPPPTRWLLQPRHSRADFSLCARRDYHDVVKGALKRSRAGWRMEAGAGVKVFRGYCARNGKGAGANRRAWLARQAQQHRQQGTWQLVVSGCDLHNGRALTSAAEGDHCGSCRACQDICPTNACPAPYRVDARRCISYLTIEHKGPIDRDLRPLMGNHIYGCDDCLAVCPWNKFAATAAAHKAFLPRAELVAPRIADLLMLDDAAFRALFSGSPVKRIGRDRFVRNVLIAAGNGQDATVIPQVENLLEDPAPVVRGAAIWALARLSPQAFTRKRQEYSAAEQDPSVRDEWEYAAANLVAN